MTSVTKFIVAVFNVLFRIPLFRRAAAGFAKITTVYTQREREQQLITTLSPNKRVLYGIFSGMDYSLADAAGSRLSPKIIGSYESELHHTYQDIFQNASRYSDVIDVGCAEGYYAVGVAMKMPNVLVHAFDTDAAALSLCKQRFFDGGGSGSDVFFKTGIAHLRRRRL
jgi:hypothetical protein